MVKKRKNIPPPKKQQVQPNRPVVVTPQPKAQVVAAVKTAKPRSETKTMDFVFGKVNYIIMIGGLVLIIIGFILMIGGGSDDPKTFNPAIFDAQRLTLAPIFILLGFVAECIAIMKKPRA